MRLITTSWRPSQCTSTPGEGCGDVGAPGGHPGDGRPTLYKHSAHSDLRSIGPWAVGTTLGASMPCPLDLQRVPRFLPLSVCFPWSVPSHISIYLWPEAARACVGPSSSAPWPEPALASGEMKDARCEFRNVTSANSASFAVAPKWPNSRPNGCSRPRLAKAWPTGRFGRFWPIRAKTWHGSVRLGRNWAISLLEQLFGQFDDSEVRRFRWG